MSNLARSFVEAVTQQFEAPDEALIWLQPELENLKAKDAKRREQRNGNPVSTGNPRGRPRLNLRRARKLAVISESPSCLARRHSPIWASPHACGLTYRRGASGVWQSSLAIGGW